MCARTLLESSANAFHLEALFMLGTILKAHKMILIAFVKEVL